MTTTTTTVNGHFTPVQSTLPTASEVVYPPVPVKERAIPAKFQLGHPDTVKVFPRAASSGIANAGAAEVSPCKSVVCTAITAIFVETTITKTTTDKTTTTVGVTKTVRGTFVEISVTSANCRSEIQDR